MLNLVDQLFLYFCDDNLITYALSRARSPVSFSSSFFVRCRYVFPYSTEILKSRTRVISCENMRIETEYWENTTIKVDTCTRVEFPTLKIFFPKLTFPKNHEVEFFDFLRSLNGLKNRLSRDGCWQVSFHLSLSNLTMTDIHHWPICEIHKGVAHVITRDHTKSMTFVRAEWLLRFLFWVVHSACTYCRQ